MKKSEEEKLTKDSERAIDWRRDVQWLASKASLDVRLQVEEISAFYEQQAVQAQQQQAMLLDQKVQHAVQSALSQVLTLPTLAQPRATRHLLPHWRICEAARRSCAPH